MTLRTAVPSVAAVAALTASLATSPATAASGDITEPESTFGNHFSQFLDRTDPRGETKVHDQTTRTHNSSATIYVDPALDSVPALIMGSAGLSHAGVKDDYDIFTNANETRSQFVRADAAGASVISSATSAEAIEELKLDFPQGIDHEATAALLRGGDSVVVFDNGDKIILREPLVYSASGKNLEAAYELDGDAIAINVDTTGIADTDLPVVAATGFEYILDFDIDGTGAPTARNAMRTPGQFNEIFPIPGAPDNFPAEGDILPLQFPFDSLGLMNFEVEMGSESMIDDPDGYDSWSYIFYATENHIDGEGSTIRFEIFNTPIEGRGVESTLAVHGVVANDLPALLPESIYLLGAKTMWEEFSLRLAKL